MNAVEHAHYEDRSAYGEDQSYKEAAVKDCVAQEGETECLACWAIER